VNINKCKNVICCNYGVGNENVILDFYRDTITGGRRSSFKRGFVEEITIEEVTTKNINTLIAEFGKPNFIKIDVEGFEEQIIEGIGTDIEESVFLIEVREETKNKIYDYFNSIKFQCIYIDGKMDIIINNSNQISPYANLIFKK